MVDMNVSGRKYLVRLLGIALSVNLVAACSRNPPPEEPVTPPPPPPAAQAESRPTPVPPSPAPPEASSPPVIERSDDFSSRTLEELNRDSPLSAVFFAYDSSELTDDARATLDANAGLLQRYNTWVITIEGHCDERGTPEYNLGLGERRALVTRDYLLTFGLEGDRIRTVSYGKEFPFDAGHTAESWAKNRRAHFVITER